MNNPIVPESGTIFTIDMDTSQTGVIWSTSPSRFGGRHPGSFQIIWSGADATDAIVSWEISNDGYNWVTWTGSLATTSEAICEYLLETPSGTQIFEVESWTSSFYRLNYDKGTNTTGSLTYQIFRNT